MNTIDRNHYRLDNPYLTQEEKVVVEMWFQFPGIVMEYVFWIMAVLSIYYPISLSVIIIIPIIVNLIAGYINWNFYDIYRRGFVKFLGLSLFHPYVTGVIGLGIGTFLFLNAAWLLAGVSVFIGFFSFLLLELHMFLYSILARKYKIHPKYVFAKRYFGYNFPFEESKE